MPCTESSCFLLPKGSDHSGYDMQGLGHVRENTQPVAQHSSLSVTPYNQSFKEMSSFMVPSTRSKSTPLRSLTAQTHNKATSANIGRPFSLSLSSLCLSDCVPVFSEKKPTGVSALSWHDCPSPAAQASGCNKAGHLKRLSDAGYMAFGFWPPSWELPGRELWLNATYPGRQIKCVCETEIVAHRPSFSELALGEQKESLWVPIASCFHPSRWWTH